MPAVTDGGRTYTFRIRPGYRFSPPSGEPVTAATFRYSIERALSPKLGPDAPAYSYLSDVVGASAFHEGDAQHVSGITVSGDRLRIRLVAPAGDFLMRLSLPYFAAVPLAHADRRRRRADADPVGRPVLPRCLVPGRAGGARAKPELPRAAAREARADHLRPQHPRGARSPADRGGQGRLHGRRARRLAVQAGRTARHEVRTSAIAGRVLPRCATRR